MSKAKVVKEKWYVIINDALSPDSPFPTEEDAEAAADRRKAADAAVDHAIPVEYLVLGYVEKE